MIFLSILQWIAVLGTIATGLVSTLFPRSVQGFTGLTAEDGRGITEIRSILGALFIGLGLSALLLERSVSFPMLGYTYLAAAGVRAISIVLDRSVVRSNLVSLGVEILFGVILIL